MLLAEDGIFPITQDSEGKALPHLPASGLSLPGTIQGEGKLCGIPSLFIRLAGCNLRCCWQSENGELSSCDTAYAAYKLQNTRPISIEEAYNTVVYNTEHLRHLVITGGEPFLQSEDIKTLCHLLKGHKDYHITVETNATTFREEAAQYIDLFSLSPKLSSSHPHSISEPPYRIDVIRQFIQYAWEQQKEFQLKFVYSCPQDITEINHILSNLDHWKNEDILLMPLGGNIETMRTNTTKTLDYCIRYGWRYCDRLHLALFGDKKGT